MNGALRRLQRFALALLLAGGLLSLTPHQAKAQTEVGQVQVKMGKVAYVPTNVIEGAVRTEEGKAEGVTVRLLNEEGDELATTRTDGKGHYRFEGRWFGDVSVTASHHGAYAHESLQLGRGVEKRVDLELYERMLMGDVMPYPEPDGDPEVIEHIEEPEIDPLPEPSPGVVYPDERILMGDTVLLPEVAEPMIMGSIQAPVDTPRPETQGPESLLRHFQQDGSFAEPGQKTRIEAGGFRATIFPNPTLDKVFVTASEPGGPELKVLLTDMGGRVLRLEDWRPGWNPVHVVDISHLPAGTYMLRLLDKEGGGEGTRIVKQ